MKTVIACLVLISVTGCSSAMFQDRRTKDCWVPNEPRESYAEINRELDECTAKTFSYRQYEACIRAKGYTFQECYVRNEQPISGQAVLKSQLAAKE